MALNIFTDIKELVTMSGAAKKMGRHVDDSDLSIIAHAAIVENNGQILWVGSKKKLTVALAKLKSQSPGLFKSKPKFHRLNADCVMPAFIECHTHLVYAGDRKHEFELRNAGATYQEIAKQGGGIQFTASETRKASPKLLLKLAQERAEEFLRQGVTTMEVKSGYGLTEKDEIKILQVAKKIKKLRVIGTYLGPHAIPQGKSADEFLKEVIQTLPKIKAKKLAERVDIFVEEGYFSLEHARELAHHAQKLQFRLTCHADQMTRTGAGVFMAGLSADSVDHLVQINDADVVQIAKSQTTAVLLPTSDLYLRMKYPPARKLLERGARVALSTDYNPGTSPTQDLSLVGVLARLEMKMKLAEVIAGYTISAAYALNLQNELGSLEVGKKCDFAVLRGTWRDLFFQIGHHPVEQVYSDGCRQFLKKS